MPFLNKDLENYAYICMCLHVDITVQIWQPKTLTFENQHTSPEWTLFTQTRAQNKLSPEFNGWAQLSFYRLPL